jgi:hypothetical protein
MSVTTQNIKYGISIITDTIATFNNSDITAEDKILGIAELDIFVSDFNSKRSNIINDILGLEDKLELPNFVISRTTTIKREVNLDRALELLGQDNVKECYTAPKPAEPKLSVTAIDKLAKKLKVNPDMVFDYGETVIKADYKYILPA